MTSGETKDDDVSPMEAQNTGPARKGPKEGALREDRPGEASDAPKSPETPMKAGGEDAARDDL